VIFGENLSFDALCGTFPGAKGLKQAQPGSFTQVDRDGAVLKELPPVWGGLTCREPHMISRLAHNSIFFC